MNSRNYSSIHGTNDQSVVSKLSSALKGYFQDDFVKYFVRKASRRSPLINRGYYIRFKAMEYALDTWLDILTHLPRIKTQIISLGAGFDTAYFRLKKSMRLKHTCKFIEIDFPEVLQTKAAIINANDELKKFLSECKLKCCSEFPEIILQATDYVLLGLNLNDIEKMEFLFNVLGVEYHLPTLVLAECSITYMDVSESDRLISWIGDHFLNSAFVLYEQVYPNDGFGCIMKRHFYSIGSPLKSIDSYPKLISLHKRFLKAGWKTIHAISMNQFFDSLPNEEKQRVQNLEIFDEYEMWHQKCSHYALVYALQGSLAPFPMISTIGHVEGLKLIKCPSLKREKANICLRRWGHGLIQVSSDSFLICGGFGIAPNRQQRLNDLVFCNIKEKQVTELNIIDPDHAMCNRIHHTTTSFDSKKILIYGGRSSPDEPHGCAVVLCPAGDSLYGITPNQLCQGAELKARDVAPKNLSYVAVRIFKSKPRWRHSASVVSIYGFTHIVIFGGCTPTEKATNDCFLLNPRAWVLMKVPKRGLVPSPRHSHSAIENGEKEFIITGGLSETEKCLNSVLVFNADTVSWSFLHIKGLLPRYSHTSHLVNGHLILVGGVNDLSSIPPYIAVVNLESLNALELIMPAQDADDIVLLHNHSSLLSGRSIITVGGGGNCFSFGTHFNKHLLVFNADHLISLHNKHSNGQ